MRYLWLTALAAAVGMGAFVASPDSRGAVPFTIYECVEPFCTEVPKNATSAIGLKASPGMVLAAFSTKSEKPLFVGAFGRHTYDESSAQVTNLSQYDIASLSKIIGATTAVAVLYQRGLIDLDEKVSSSRLLGADFGNKGKGEITVRNLLLHNSGLPADPIPGYDAKSFPCRQNKEYFPGLSFECMDTIYNDLLFNQGMKNPVGKVAVYSDLSMITLMYIVGKIVRDEGLVSAADLVAPCEDATLLSCYYNSFLVTSVWAKMGLKNTGFLPRNIEIVPPEWEEYSGYRHQLVKGVVSDRNCYAMGGISGHAGVFSDMGDSLRFMRAWMSETHPDLLNATTIKLFTTVGNIAQSSRALGWDTNEQNYKFCGSLSPSTFTHTGYTGTEYCGDPITGIATVMLTNARYPSHDVSGMSWYRPQFNSLIHELSKRRN